MPSPRFAKGNPGKPKGAISRTHALKKMLEELLDKNAETFKVKFVEMLENKRNFKWLCDLKAQFELKELPTKVDGISTGPINVTVEIQKNENQAPSEPGNRISKYIEV